MKKLNSLLIPALISTSLLLPACSQPLKTQHGIDNVNLCERLDPNYVKPKYLPQIYSINTGQNNLIEYPNEHNLRKKPSLLEVSYESAKLFFDESDNRTIRKIDEKKDKIERFIDKITTFYIAGWKVEIKGTGFYATKE